MDGGGDRGDPGRQLTRLAPAGALPRGRPRGFIPGALIEVYFWVAVGMVLVAILLPQVFDGKARRRDVASFSATLARLEVAQRAHHARTGTYAARVDELRADLPGRTPRILRADSAGWMAVVESAHLLRPRVTCGIFDGPASYAPHPAVARPRQVACWGVWLWARETREGG